MPLYVKAKPVISGETRNVSWKFIGVMLLALSRSEYKERGVFDNNTIAVQKQYLNRKLMNRTETALNSFQQVSDSRYFQSFGWLLIVIVQSKLIGFSDALLISFVQRYNLIFSSYNRLLIGQRFCATGHKSYGGKNNTNKVRFRFHGDIPSSYRIPIFII